MVSHNKNFFNVLIPFKGDTVGGSHISTLIFLKELQNYYNLKIVLYKHGILEEILKKYKFQYKVEALQYTKYRYFNYINLYSIFQKVRYLKIKKISFVYTNDIEMHLTWVLPCILTGKNHIWHQRTPNKKAILFSNFSNLVTISEYTRKSFPRLLTKKAKVIYNPFIIHKNLGKVCSRNPKLGFIGNLIKRKNLNVFIDILSNLNNDFHGVVLGETREPEYSNAIKQINKLKINGRIDFKGLVFPIENYLSEIDILIAPATDEAFGRNLVEAMMLGIPVLALDYGGHKEIIEDEIDGFLIKDNNIDMYIEKIKLLVNNPDLYQAISKKAHKKASDKFSVDTHVKKMTEFYNEILNK